MSEKFIVNTDKAPAVFGPFSQAIKTDTLIFTSGQLPIDPATGEIVAGDIKKETRQVLFNLKEILIKAASSLEDVVKTTVFITNMDDFPKVNDVYEEFFPNQHPARSCIAVSGLAKGANVEIEAIALLGKS